PWAHPSWIRPWIPFPSSWRARDRLHLRRRPLPLLLRLPSRRRHPPTPRLGLRPPRRRRLPRRPCPRRPLLPALPGPRCLRRQQPGPWIPADLPDPRLPWALLEPACPRSAEERSSAPHRTFPGTTFGLHSSFSSSARISSRVAPSASFAFAGCLAWKNTDWLYWFGAPMAIF